MTSRSSVGTQPRPPQRGLTGVPVAAGAAPRRPLNQPPAAAQRPASPSKKENYIDLTGDTAVESSSARPAKLAGSRLKIEVAASPTRAAATASPDALPPAKPFPPPRGRPKLHFEGPTPAVTVNGTAVLPEETGNPSQQPLPMPARPQQHQHQPTAPRPRAKPAPVKKDSRPKPYVMEVPADAPRYPPNGHADFYPWTGNHPEDGFSETIIRQGYYDKPSAQNETGSAKAALFPSLKHKSGLQSLSALYTSVLALRRNQGQITSTSTFKPPPRVTLTDTKRETWLRDLANPSISLRRLSRTIPHGIRGKVLLEQCLSKHIPTERAVWLARCVGANEIRAFKRKGMGGTLGMGGEAKWIRDWTAFVEQFLEGVANGCGDQTWKNRVNYAVRLAAHLYSEHLLDREHYLDWLITSLESCPLTRAPIWFLITQVYWKQLLQHRKHGRRLVAALCSHLQSCINTPDKDLFSPVKDRIVSLLKSLVVFQRHNFVSPIMWSKYAEILHSNMSEDPKLAPLLDGLGRRNKRFSTAVSRVEASPRRRIVNYMDCALTKLFADDLALACWTATVDRSTMVQTVLDWSTSPYRPGVTKIFVGARLLRTWAQHGVNIDDELLLFLGSDACERRDQQALFHLVSELVRSRHFPVAKYLQWLIARGSLRNGADEEASCATRLLAELPLEGLSSSIIDLRRSILSRATFSAKDEISRVDNYINYMSSRLQPQRDAMEVDNDVPLDIANFLTTSSRTVKSRIGTWLRHQVRQCVTTIQISSSNWKTPVTKGVSLMITLADFDRIRQDLEVIEDFSMLADVLKLATLSNDPTVLAAVANTANLHLETMAAIGALRDLLETLRGRMQVLKADPSRDSRILLVALTRLAARIPSLSVVSSQLTQELAHADRKTAADACSPVSDHMVEVIQNTEVDFADELEKLLASGTSVDQQTLERLFHFIMTRLEASWLKFTDQQRSCGVLLARLRTFDVKAFDELMLSWVEAFLQHSVRQTMSHSLAPLISVGCLTLADVVATSLRLLETPSISSDPSIAPVLALETLQLLTGTSQLPSVMDGEDMYAFGIFRRQFVKDDPLRAIQVIQRAAESTSTASASDDSIRDQLVSCCHSTQVHSLLQGLVLADVDATRNSLIGAITASEDSQVKSLLDCMIHGLLTPDASSESLRNTVARINAALKLSDDLSLQFCQLEIEAVLATGVVDASSDEDPRQQCLAVLGSSITSAVAVNSNTTWTSLMPVLDATIVSQIREGAQRSLLELYPHPKQAGNRDFDLPADVESAKRLLFVIEATATNAAELSSLDFPTQVAEKLNHTWQLISQGTAAVQQAVAKNWLPILLSVVNMSLDMFDTHKSGADLRGRGLIALSAIVIEIQRHMLNMPQLLEALFDTAMVFSDGLTEETRTSCVRLLKDRTSDPHIQYIFGFNSKLLESLQLNQKGKTITFQPRRWELLSEPTPIIGENDTSLSLTLFQARKD